MGLAFLNLSSGLDEYFKANVKIIFANLWETSLWKHRKSIGLPKFIPQDYFIENMGRLALFFFKNYVSLCF